jgi:hypothetical protein
MLSFLAGVELSALSGLSSVWAIIGSTTLPPRSTVRIASTIFWASFSLSKWPVASAAKAERTVDTDEQALDLIAFYALSWTQNLSLNREQFG